MYLPGKFTGIMLLLSILSVPVLSQNPDLSLTPPRYICYRAEGPITIDGKPDEASWQKAPWTENFTNLAGPEKPAPALQTRVKLLWDDENLYVAFESEEPDIWDTMTVNESPLFQENDVEIFIDPDGDTHNYCELEINAINTTWDLLLEKPYRDGGPGLTGWNIRGLKSAVSLRGTLNNPADRDTGWNLEVSIPWKSLAEIASGKPKPEPGENWRMDFMRVEWPHTVVNGQYSKQTDPATGKTVHSFFWTWAPIGIVSIHCPERWGYVQFSSKTAGLGKDSLRPDPDEPIRTALRRIYYLQRDYMARNHCYATSLKALQKASGVKLPGDISPRLDAAGSVYDLSAPSADRKGTWHIRQDGRIWKE